MENLPTQITIQCSNCQKMVEIDTDQLKEDNFYVCHHCLSTIPISTDKLLEALKALMKKAEEHRHMKSKEKTQP